MCKLITASVVLAACHILYSQTTANSAVPKPTMDLTVGTWKYATKTAQPDGTYFSTDSIAIKDEGSAWTVTITLDTPDGRVTEVSTLEKGTLVLLKESFRHFAKRGQPRKPVKINLDFIGNRVTGTTTNGLGKEDHFARDLDGPVFADAPKWIGCLPLVEGYSTTVRNFDLFERKVELMQVGVASAERIVVPAGTFDAYKVELAPASGTSEKQTVWIAKDSRIPVKISEVETLGGGTSTTTTELVP